jgi:hypothetical protein
VQSSPREGLPTADYWTVPLWQKPDQHGVRAGRDWHADLSAQTSGRLATWGE